MTRDGVPAAAAPERSWSDAPSGRWCALAVMLPVAVGVAGLVTGARTLFFRDIFNLHLPAKVAQAAAWREGLLPLVDPFRAGGQPSLGNLNTLPLYPDNLLYLLADGMWALNAHFWLHLLLAPLAACALGRAFGLSRPASWAVAATYVFAGSFLSQAGFYNLVPAATLAPALVAAALWASRHAWSAGEPPSSAPAVETAASRAGSRFGSVLALALLWCLLLLGGDPILAAQALAAAGLAVALDPARPREGSVRRRMFATARVGLRLIPALGAGTLLASPQIVGLLQTLGFSYRGYIGYVEQSTLVASWDPRQVLEWFLPLAFGSPQLGFWGAKFSGGQLPLFFSVHPGLLAIALVVVAVRARGGAAAWGWATVGCGLFFALGAWNPVVRWLVRVPGADLLRFPVKFYLLVGLGGAVLCGIGLDRALRGGSRELLRACGVVLLVVLALLAVLLQVPDRVEGWLASAGELSATQATVVRMNWTASAGIQSLLALALVTVAAAMRKRPGVAVVVLLALHGATQLLWLRAGLLPTDDALAYRGRPPLLEHVQPGETLVHGGYGDMFGPARVSGLPDRRLLWVQRRGFLELYPFIGVRFGRKYELNVSAEGLDSFLSDLALKVMRRLDDGQRLRVLRALGVEAFVLDRPLSPPLPPWVRPRAEVGSIGGKAYLYGLDGVPDLVVAGTVHRAPNVNGNISIVIDPRFDPGTMAVVPGTGPAIRGAPGVVTELVADEAERLEARVSATGPSVLVAQRAYLPLYRAEVDGRPARLTVANLDRLALELPAGEHHVRIWADRRPLRWSLAGVVAGVLVLVGSALRATRLARAEAASPRQPSADTGE